MFSCFIPSNIAVVDDNSFWLTLKCEKKNTKRDDFVDWTVASYYSQLDRDDTIYRWSWRVLFCLIPNRHPIWLPRHRSDTTHSSLITCGPIYMKAAVSCFFCNWSVFNTIVTKLHLLNFPLDVLNRLWKICTSRHGIHRW